MKINYWVYAICSKKQNRIYVGLSADINKRLKQHNAGQVFATKGYRPWELLYSEKVGDRPSARVREKYLKSGYGKEFLKKYIRG